jgi:type VI secretion system secreted protein Hcp
MAENMWIKMDGCKGEATDDKHKEEIDVDSYSWGMSHPVDPGGTGQSAGESTATQLVVSKTVDKATPNLMKFCMNAKSFPTVVLTCRKRGENPIEYMKITMKNAIVASVQDSGSGDGSPAQESVSFAFTAVEVEYTPQKEDGTPDGSVKATWDFAANKE